MTSLILGLHSNGTKPRAWPRLPLASAGGGTAALRAWHPVRPPGRRLSDSPVGCWPASSPGSIASSSGWTARAISSSSSGTQGRARRLNASSTHPSPCRCDRVVLGVGRKAVRRRACKRLGYTLISVTELIALELSTASELGATFNVQWPMARELLLRCGAVRAAGPAPFSQSFVLDVCNRQAARRDDARGAGGAGRAACVVASAGPIASPVTGR